MQKDRITLSMCVNATGTDKLKLVIHTAKRPRDFGRTWQPTEFVHCIITQVRLNKFSMM